MFIILYILIFIIILTVYVKFTNQANKIYINSKSLINKIRQKYEYKENSSNSRILFKQININQGYDKQEALNSSQELDPFKLALSGENTQRYAKDVQILHNNSAFSTVVLSHESKELKNIHENLPHKVKMEMDNNTQSTKLKDISPEIVSFKNSSTGSMKI